MSLFDTIMSDTVGVAWRAASGTLDPWSVNEINQENAQNVVQASGGTISQQQALQQSQQDTQTVLQTFPSGSAAPSDFWAGVKRTGQNVLSSVESGLSSTKTILVALAVLAAVGALFVYVPHRKA
jgi:hypothetical protein